MGVVLRRPRCGIAVRPWMVLLDGTGLTGLLAEIRWALDKMRNHPTQRQAVRSSAKLLAAVAGVSLVAAALFTAYQTAWRMYYDYYFYARMKEEYVAPDRWVRVMDGLYVVELAVVLYIAYRLLRYSIRPARLPNR